jgi:hypothetical protein
MRSRRWRRGAELLFPPPCTIAVSPAEAQIASVIEQLKQLQADNRSYDVQGVLPDGRWYIGLFKRHFAAVVSEGYVSQAKLRCEKSHVSLPFDPKLQYEVPGRYGSCSIELEGAPGTRFKLIQF